MMSNICKNITVIETKLRTYHGNAFRKRRDYKQKLVYGLCVLDNPRALYGTDAKPYNRLTCLLCQHAAGHCKIFALNLKVSMKGAVF